MKLFGRLMRQFVQPDAPQAGMGSPVPDRGRRVMVFTEHFNATYFISFDRPLRRLSQEGRAGFRAYSQQDVAACGTGGWRAWLDAYRPEIVFMTRYGQADGVEIVQECQRRGLPVVYHIDDNLLDLPASLGPEILKRQGAATEARRAMLAACDLVYASTEVLAGELSAIFPGKPMFHGIYAASFRIDLPGPAAAPTVGYMGSKGHKEDLALAVPALVALMRERPELRFETFGTIEMPAELRIFGDRVRHHAVHKGYDEFLRKLASLGWSVGLAPLVDEPFNRCKAPTKYIEYTGCGIPVVASKVDVYTQAIPSGAGLLVDLEWKDAIEELLDNPAVAAGVLREARIHCERVFAPELLSEQLLNVCDRALHHART